MSTRIRVAVSDCRRAIDRFLGVIEMRGRAVNTSHSLRHPVCCFAPALLARSLTSSRHPGLFGIQALARKIHPQHAPLAALTELFQGVTTISDK